MKKNLDISKVPARFVYLEWLSRIIKHFDNLIISPEQVYIFGDLFNDNNQHWDSYRDHMIYVKVGKEKKTIAEYEGRSVFGGST